MHVCVCVCVCVCIHICILLNNVWGFFRTDIYVCMCMCVCIQVVCLFLFSGPMCFDLRRGWTGHFKNRIAIPERSAMTSDSKKRFCSQRCETNRFCMGFELRDNTPECFFANLHILHDANFNLFLRRC